MKIERIFTYCLLIGASLLASCSNEEMADSQAEALPEGMYPLTFTAMQGEVVATPQTRVSDYDDTDGTHKSKWDGGEQIKVQIGTGTAGTYILNADGTINEQAANTPAYWQSNATGQTINAWYPASAASNYLKNQSGALPYVLKATATADFNTTPQLPFKHQLAKFRFKLTGTAITQGVIPAVSVKGIANTTYTNGDIQATSGAAAEDIAPHKDGNYYEVLLLPGQVADNFITISVPDIGTYHYTPQAGSSLTANLTLAAANSYTYDITVNKPGPTTYPAGSTIPEITDDGEYIIEGNGSQTTNGIVINGSPSVILKNVNISSNLGIEIKSGSPTIHIEDTCHLTSSEGSAIALTSENANVEIKGSGTNPTLIVTGGNYQPGIGGNDNSFGNIYIEGITLTAYGHEAAPGIGSGLSVYSGQVKKSGWIYIKNSTVTASGKYDSFYSVSPAAIGNSSITGGASLEQGDITIENTSMTKSEILSTLTQLSGSHKIGNGTGGNTSAGTITIGTIKIIAKDGTFKDERNGYIDD